MVVKLPAKERILIYLHENIKEQLPIKEKFPRVFSMEGIIEKTDLSQPLVSYATGALMRAGLLEKKRQYVEATGRFRSFYFLTAEGIMRAKYLENYVGQLVISIREKDKIKDFKILDLIEHLKKLSKKQAVEPMDSREIISYTNILKNIFPEGVLDLKLLFAPKKYIDYSEKRPEIKYFVGREKEIRKIKEFIRGKTKILCVKGIAGIGKTTLLSKFVENLEMNIFWHRFTEFSTLRGLLTKISGFLSKMDRRKLENYLKGERFEVEEILISLEEGLKGSNTLFVFDDFQKARKEIVDFFCSFKDLETDVKTVIIGRTIQRFYDRRDVIVKKNIMETVIGDLDKESSIKLLKHRKIEKDLERLYFVTKGHPLMLKLITPETKAEAEEFLREEILKKLGPRERKALEISSVFRYPFPSMAIINDIDYTTLDNLEDKSLMQKSGDVYDLHDTIREFFYRRLGKKEKIGYHKIVAKYYEKQKYEDAIIEAIYHYIHANRYKKAVGLAIDHGDRIISRGFAPEFLSVLSELDATRMIKISNLKAECCYNIGKWDEALKHYQAPLKFTKTLLNENLLEIAKSHIGIGKIDSKRGMYKESMNHFKKALKIFEENNSIKGIADTHTWLSGLYLHTGKLATAMRHINKCQKLSKSIGDLLLYGEALMDEGNIYHLRGDYRKSIGLYNLFPTVFKPPCR
jgi:tetratricopeptide (TPR) repeat protein/DNA-binding MarR family transcriptional regulator